MALTYTWDLTSSFVYLFYITKDYIYKRLQEDKKKANFNKALKRETNHFASQNGFCILQKREKKKKKLLGFFYTALQKCYTPARCEQGLSGIWRAEGSGGAFHTDAHTGLGGNFSAQRCSAEQDYLGGMVPEMGIVSYPLPLAS